MKKDWMKSKWFSGFVFCILFIGLSWFYNYNTTFRLSPQSVHSWRQTNSLSMTQMYFQYHLPFFQPEIQNQESDQGLSGKTVGEFPIIYFTMAKIWQVFGKSECSFRIFQLIILFIGIFLLFRMLTPVTGNPVRAGFISMLVFTSPMVIFYGPNFLPDAPALAFIFAAWLFLYQFVIKHKYYLLWISAAFFFLALSLKVISGTSFIAIGTWIIFETFFLKPEKRIFNFRFKHYIPFIVSLLFILVWYWYVRYYNALHAGHFSIFSILPIWEISTEKIKQIILALKLIYFKEFMAPPLQYATILIWIFMLFKIRRISPFFAFLLIIMPISLLSIVLLWFQVLEAHDYYMITQLQVMVIVWVIFFSYLKDKKLWNHPIAYILLIVIFALLANNGIMRHKARYEGWMNDNYKIHFETLTKIEPSFEKWNIKPDDKVISLPDFAINTTLYYMNRRGYTEFGCDYLREEIFRQRISQGAKYLVINDTTILEKPEIQKFATYFVGRYSNVKVFDLRPFIHE